MYDVAVIGAGIAGCTCARELTRYGLSVVVLESGSDIASGTTRANSGIVHAGYDPVPGTLKAHYNILGARLFPHLAEELDFPYLRTGSYVVAFSDEDVDKLTALLERGRENGVSDLEIIDADELHRREPNLSGKAVGALWAPTAAIINPYMTALAFAENAVAAGAEFSLSTTVAGLRRCSDGTFVLDCTDHDVQARAVVNAAGVDAGDVADMVSTQHIDIITRAGEYCLLDTEFKDSFRSVVFQTPTPQGKGVLVLPTTGGNILIGPDALPRDTYDTSTTPGGLEHILEVARRSWEDIPVWGIITNFAGLRATNAQTADFVIGQAPDVPGFFNIAAFDSPGLTSAPAVALDIAAQIADLLGASVDPQFNPTRRAIPSFSACDDAKREELIGEDPAWGHIICRCEKVTEAQIVAAIHSPIPATTLDAIKWRTRAGMGRCQSGFCMPEVACILSRELGIGLDEVCKRGPGSPIVVGMRKGESHEA